MPINNITQTISTIPEAGRRGVDVQTQFVIKQEDFQDHLQGTTVTELNTLKDQLNTRIGEINSTTTTMNGYATSASSSASTATTKAGEASTSATAALNSKNQASTFATNSSNSATKASQWADYNYNVEVEAGKYSAKHWATVAQDTVNNKVDKVISTDNAIVRFNGITGDLQNSGVIIDDSGNIGSGAQSFNGFGGSGFKNKIVNGNFNVWQRGTSFSATGFTADRWFLSAAVNSQRISLSPEETELTGAEYALRFNAGTYVSYKIEDVRTLAGKKATLSFWSKSGASKTLYNLYLRQHFGTSGSAYVDTVFSSTTFNNTTELTKHTFTVTLPTIVGKTIGSDNTHYIEIFFESQNDGIYTDITGVQFEEGSIATPFENRPYGLELSLCQRYCFNPKYGADIANQVIRGDAYSEDAVNGWANFKFPVPMRITPSLYLSAGVTQLYIGYPDSIQLIALSQSVVSCNEAVFTYTASSVSVANKHYNLYMPNSVDKILFIAELWE